MTAAKLEVGTCEQQPKDTPPVAISGCPAVVQCCPDGTPPHMQAFVTRFTVSLLRIVDNIKATVDTNVTPSWAVSPPEHLPSDAATMALRYLLFTHVCTHAGNAPKHPACC